MLRGPAAGQPLPRGRGRAGGRAPARRCCEAVVGRPAPGRGGRRSEPDPQGGAGPRGAGQRAGRAGGGEAGRRRHRGRRGAGGHRRVRHPHPPPRRRRAHRRRPRGRPPGPGRHPPAALRPADVRVAPRPGVAGRAGRRAEVAGRRPWARSATPTSSSSASGARPRPCPRPTPPGAASLVRRLVQQREVARAELLEAMAGPRYVELLDRLVAAAQNPVLLPEADGKATEVLPALVLRPWKKLAKAVKELDDPPPDEQLHAVRIRAKRVPLRGGGGGAGGRQAGQGAWPRRWPGCRACSATTRTRWWPRRGCGRRPRGAGVSQAGGGRADRPPAGRGRGAPPGVVGGVARGEGSEAAEVAPLSLGRLGLGRGRPGPVRAGGRGGVAAAADDGRPRCILVHRPKYDDWSLPKGKLDAGEDEADAALREVEEETGLRCALGPELPGSRYHDRFGRDKTVRYWAMTPESRTGRRFVPNDEVDEVRWLHARRGRRPPHLRPRPRDPALVAVPTADPVTVAALLVVRHAHAGDREKWEGPDERRPLTKKGRRQAAGLVDLLAGFDVEPHPVQPLRPLPGDGRAPRLRPPPVDRGPPRPGRGHVGGRRQRPGGRAGGHHRRPLHPRRRDLEPARRPRPPPRRTTTSRWPRARRGWWRRRTGG